MTRGRIRLLEAATWWPPAYMVFFLVLWLISVFGMVLMPLFGVGAGAAAGGVAGDPMVGEAVAGGVMGLLMMVWLGGFAVVAVLHVFTMVVMVALMVVYAVLVFKNADLEQNTQLLWVLLIFVGGPIGQLFYLYKVVKGGVA